MIESDRRWSVTDDVPVVDEEEDALAERPAVRLAEEVVELLVELHVVTCEKVVEGDRRR